MFRCERRAVSATEPKSQIDKCPILTAFLSSTKHNSTQCIKYKWLKCNNIGAGLGLVYTCGTRYNTKMMVFGGKMGKPMCDTCGSGCCYV